MLEPVEAFDALGDPVRRRVLEHLAQVGELSAGGLVALVREEFGISQPAVSQHLRVLREHGFATVRAEGRRRLYAVDARGPLVALPWVWRGFDLRKLLPLVIGGLIAVFGLTLIGFFLIARSEAALNLSA